MAPESATEHPSIVHAPDLPWQAGGNGARYVFQRKSLGQPAGGHKIGTSLYELPPGKSDFPHHYHHANEEALYVLEGEGTLELGEKNPSKHSIRSGDYVALPVGPDHCHRVTNTSDAPLRFLCISTMDSPEVAVYPETNKVGIMTGGAPGQRDAPGRIFNLWPRNESMGYYDGEDDAS